jgi:hypothetical protein
LNGEHKFTKLLGFFAHNQCLFLIAPHLGINLCCALFCVAAFRYIYCVPAFVLFVRR